MGPLENVESADILLVIPPPTPSVMPFAASGYLATPVKKAGFSISNLDLGLAATLWFADLDRLSSARKKSGVSEVDASTRAGRFEKISSSLAVRDAGRALNTLRSSYTDMALHREACAILTGAFGLQSAAATAGRLGLGTYEHPWPDLDLEEIQSRLLSEEDVYSPFLFAVVECVLRLEFGVVALSVQHAEQLLPALSLAKGLRLGGFDRIIAIGGVQIGFLREQIETSPEFFRYLTLASPRMGEATLPRLVHVAHGRESLNDVPNLIVPVDGGVKYTGGYTEPNISTLDPPDFSQHSLGLYLVPEPTLPLRSATRCYWGRCKFCRITGDHLFDSLGVLPAEVTYQHMKSLWEKSRCRSFVFADDATSPTMLTHLSRQIVDDSFPARWTCIGLRPERKIDRSTLELWKAAGCAAISMGFESGSQRMIDLMHKHQRVEDVERILRDCREIGIMTFCYGFYGHPLETKEDLRQTLEFKKRNEKVASYFAAGRWLISPYNVDYHETESLGITLEEPACFPWGRDFWYEWTSPRKAEQLATTQRLLEEYGHVSGSRNYLSDWVYWGQGMHIPYEWMHLAQTSVL